MHIQTLPSRSNMNEAFTWDLRPLYPDTGAFEKDFEEAGKDLSALTDFKNHLSDSPASLYGYLTEKDRQLLRLTRLYSYAFQKSDEDAANSTHQSQKSRALRLYMDFNSATAYEGPEILDFPEGLLVGFFKEMPEL